MRPMPLSSILAGMTRLRVKGGASQQSLYDLLNGFVTNARSMQIRPGTLVDAKLPAFTKGLCGFRGKLVIFCNTVVAAPSSKYQVAVIVHPTTPSLKLREIHFAAPFVGALYVAAEFTNGDVYHYWLEEAAAWKANTVYFANQLVTPTVVNGFAYRAVRKIDGFPAWAPRVARALNDRVEPSVYTGFYYKVTDISGTNPISGVTEPIWPVLEGQTVLEELTATGETTSGTLPPVPGDPPATGGDPYCVHVDSYLGEDLQAQDYFVGLMADLHSPERGFYRGPCKFFRSRELVDCVRIRTTTASLIVSCTTPVNHADAVADLSDGTYSLAPDLLGKSVLVQGDIEPVVSIEHLGPMWVQPMNFGDASFGASELRGGRKIYTHNIRAKDPP